MATTANKDIIQSYILTTAKYDFSAYEKRILYRLVELNQYILEGKKIGDGCKIDTTLFGNKEYTIPIKYFLKDDKDDNYKEVKKALNRLKKKEITYEDNDIWASLTIIAFPKIVKYSDTVTFTVDNMIHNALLNFSKGYRKYELTTAMQFESIYAMRFYELMSGQKQPITYSIENLKEMFQIQDKYERVNDFKKYVLDIAIRELDRCSPYTFTYKMNKTGRSFTSVTFFPKYQPQFRDSELDKKDLQKQISPAWDLPKNVLSYLKNSFGIDTKGIKQNIDLFKLASERFDLIQFMANIKPRANRAKNPIGYLINAIKKELKL